MTKMDQAAGAVLGRPIPRPAITLETREFWDAAREGRFLVKRCSSCGEVFWYPRGHCPLCHSGETRWEESSGAGTIYSYSIVRNFPTGPFAIGYVALDEGPVMLTNFIGFAESELAIGLPVKVRFIETEGEGGPPAPVFGPA
jgi:uncharacterized protein